MQNPACGLFIQERENLSSDPTGLKLVLLSPVALHSGSFEEGLLGVIALTANG